MCSLEYVLYRLLTLLYVRVRVWRVRVRVLVWRVQVHVRVWRVRVRVWRVRVRVCTGLRSCRNSCLLRVCCVCVCVRVCVRERECVCVFVCVYVRTSSKFCRSSRDAKS